MGDSELQALPIGALLTRRRERGRNGDPLLSVTQDRGIIPQEEVGRRNTSSADKSTYWRVYPDDIVYNTMRMWQGASARSDHFGVVSPAYTVCCPCPGVSPRFLAYALKLPEHIKVFRSRSQGLTSDVWSLRFEELAQIQLKFAPDRRQQDKIADILNSVDESIDQSRAVLNQVQIVQRGVMRQLLSRGIPGRHSRYRSLDGAQLPAGWRLGPLGDVGTWASGGTPSRQDRDYWEGTIPWVSGKDMKRPRLADTLEHVSKDAVGSGTRLTPAGSILIVTRGMILAHTLPVALTLADVTFNQDLKALVPDDRFDAEFLLYWFQYRERQILSLVDTASHGTKRLPTAPLFTVLVPRPKLEEQAQIAVILRAFDSHADALSQEVDRLVALKSALMSVLLTGEIRVTPDAAAP